MLEFLIGLVAGGAIGVVCDRLWRKVENRVRLRIQGGFCYGLDGEAISFKVKNVGNERLPPLRLCVFAPKIGSYYVFPPARAETEREELLPGQEREFLCRANPAQGPRLDPRPMFQAVAGVMNDPHVVFRIQPVDGDTIIFSNHRIGKAIASVFTAYVDGRGIGNVGGIVWGDMNYERRGPIGWIRHKLYIRAALKEAMRTPKAP
jgi:hypothetical protein